jgi:Tfp pilus assembly protein PilN
MLAVEICGHQIIGAVAEGRGRKLTVQNFVIIERSNPTDDLPDPANLKELSERLDYSSGPMALVTPMARSVQVTMNRGKVKKLRQYQLCDALRWEVEPYTGISGTQALIGAERVNPAEQEELVLLTEADPEMDVNVSVIEQNVYRAMRQICKRAKLRLIRLYPPEVCFFIPLFLDQPDVAQAVFDIGQDYANFTVIKGRQPKQINTYPLGREVLLEIIEGGEESDPLLSLDFLLKQVPGPVPLALTGVGATQREIVNFLNQRCEYGAQPMELHRADKLGRASHDGQNALYCVAVGAALREISSATWQLIGITDAIPLPVRIRQSGHLVPIGAAILMAGGLLAHYGYMKNCKERYKKQIVELESKTAVRKTKFDQYDKLETQLKNLERKTTEHKKKIAFLKQGADDNLIHLEQVLVAFFSLPEAMRLESVSQQKDGGYLVQGITEDSSLVGRFAVQLQKHAWCRSVRIKAMEQKGEEGLQFTLELNTSETLHQTTTKTIAANQGMSRKGKQRR